MKILIVNTSDIQGGAARAAYRLHRALLGAGVDSRMLVLSKSTDNYTVIKPETTLAKALAWVRSILDCLPVIFYRDRTKKLFSPAWVPMSGMAAAINALNPDIVHLHWICRGMMRIEDIPGIKAPIVWSLHDMWPFTGGCHYAEGCGKYRASCGDCPALSSHKENDLSHSIYKRKRKSFAQVRNLTIVGLSRWLAGCAKESSLFANRSVVNLPNPIDTARFAPVNKSTARSILNLPSDKKLVLFGALNATGDQRKGYKELVAALRLIPQDQTRELVVFGSCRPQDPPDFGFPSHYLGQLHDDVTLQLLYSAADVVVVPSLQEAFGQTASEAMSCGTPVVAFGTTGLLDIVDHQTNGYLAKPFDIDDLAKGIEWVLTAPNQLKLSQNARAKIIREFNGQAVAEKYIQLYKKSLDEQNCAVLGKQTL